METSCSGYQRAKKHQREVLEGMATHPMNLHFIEEHQGIRQENIFRIVSKHWTALERQVMESVRIEELASKQEEALNLKSE